MPTVHTPRGYQSEGIPGSGRSPAEIDELVLNQCLRWCSSRNKILRLCRHTKGCDLVLDFDTVKEAIKVLEAFRDEKVHLANEVRLVYVIGKNSHTPFQATVAAISAFSDDPSLYNAHPMLVSATCKKEGNGDQCDLIRSMVEAVESAPKDNPNLHLWSVATDGDPTRRPIFYSLFTARELELRSTLRTMLGEMQLFDYRCGENDITADCDFKHVIRRFRSMLLRVRGVFIDGVLVNEATMKTHFRRDISAATLRSLLNPNDKQDVPLTLGPLSCFRAQSEERDDDSVSLKASRRIFNLLGHLYTDLLEPYTNVTLSLSDQLLHLSSLAHLMMVLYSVYKGNLCSVQLYYDTMVVIKSAYFCVAKTKVADPDGRFWLSMLGTDALEKLFGIVRTMVSTDTNCDILQLNERLTSAAMVSEIFNHPDWSKGPRRLQITSTVEEVKESRRVSQKVDHINPKSWVGDVGVRGVNMKTCWKNGRDRATKCLSEVGININFEDMVELRLLVFRPLSSKPDHVVSIGHCEGEESDESMEAMIAGEVEDDIQ